MKFISKSSNLLIVLRPGLSAQPLTGTPAKPTISVRFKDGVAEVSQPDLVEMMLAHPGFNGDFISAEGVPNDPFANTRQSSEPAHVLTEMKYGTPVSKVIKGGNVNLSPEMRQLVESMAANMAKSMLLGMVESTLKGLVDAHNPDKKEEKLEEELEEAEEAKQEEVVESKPIIKPLTKATKKVPETSKSEETKG